MPVLIRNRYFLLVDLFLLPLAAYMAFVLRSESLVIRPSPAGFLLFTAVNVAAIVLACWWSGVYARYWLYASIDELLLLVSAVGLAILAAGISVIFATLLLPAAFSIPHTLPLIFLLLAIAAVVSPRLLVRWLGQHGAYPQRNGQRMFVLIMGAGSAGAMVARELRHNPQLGIVPVGFIDDDPRKLNIRLHSIPVLGNRSDIARLAQHYGVRQLVIAMPTAPGRTIREIVNLCERAQVKTKIVPSLTEMLTGKVNIAHLRDVQIEDLLRRQQVETDIQAVATLVRGRRVLVTGAGGSIGSELCRQLLRFAPAELMILGHGEDSLFVIEHELRTIGLGETKLTNLLADIRFAERMLQLFERHQPEIIFHAAAHKHVPLTELHPVEAITNNILGTRNLLIAAERFGVKHFVMISSDKAVNPTSIMGASKRTAEYLVLQAARRTGMPYVAVRFGNVLGSRGSVALTFKRQIAAGGPITITHPEMSRYFMTIPEAVQLVLQAATLGQGGEIFTLDMGEPIKIVDLARDMIELSGLEVGRDIEIHFTGLRPGEKLSEELFFIGERYERTVHEKIFIACNASAFIPEQLDAVLTILEQAAARDDQQLILAALQSIVPELHRYISPQAEEQLVQATITPPLIARVVGAA